MGVFENLPYTNFHELNLEWVVKKIKELEERQSAAPVETITAQDAGIGHILVSNLHKMGKLVTGYVSGTITSDATEGLLLTGIPKPLNNEIINTLGTFIDAETSAKTVFPVESIYSGTQEDPYQSMYLIVNESSYSDPDFSVSEGDTFFVYLTYLTEEE